MMSYLQDCLQKTASLHSHLCPRQVLGVRIGMYAGELLGHPLPEKNKRLFAFVETDGCFADGVSVATGCSLGRRTMRLVDYGKVAATFVDTKTMQAMRIAPSHEARSLALLYAPQAESPWHAQLEAYGAMHANKLLRVEGVTVTLSMQELISRPGLRATCCVCGEEIMNAREVVQDGRVLCRPCADQGAYYSVACAEL